MKIVAIHQPNYIPWLGYFYKINQADVFVFLDDAQFSNEGMHNWHYIKTPGGPLRLKIPVQQTLGDKINQVCTKDELGWKQKHLKTVENFYRKAPYFVEIYEDFKTLLEHHFTDLAGMNEALIRLFSGKLGFTTTFIKSSDLQFNSSREQKILDICKAVSGTIYFSGTGAKAYQKEENFTSQGIELRYIVYKPFEYPQLYNGFIVNVSILDFLMNCGYDWDRVMKHQSLYL